jgi:hypothetical protein
MTLNCLETNDKPVEYDDDGFPWDSVGKQSSVSMSRASTVAAIKITTGMSYAGLAVCRHLQLSMGHVSEAIVFDRVYVSMGSIKNLHCLSTTTQKIGMGSIKNVKFHPKEELVKMALEKLDLSPGPSAPLVPVPINAYEVTEDNKGQVESINAYKVTEDNKEQAASLDKA